MSERLVPTPLAQRLARYPEYRDSGVEWLGEIPAHWEVRRNKLLFREIDDRSRTGSETLLSVSEYFGVRPRSEVIDDGEWLTRAESLVGYKMCQPGDLAMNFMLAWKRGLGFSDFSGLVSPSYAVFRPLGTSHYGYFHYLLRSMNAVREFRRYSYGIIDSRLRLYPDTFGNLRSPVPPLAEQHTIADFLDREMARTDALVAKQRELIKLLQEKRTAVIGRAVTKGLDPDVAMKDSGVESLGEIPAHWERIRTDGIFRCDKIQLDPSMIGDDFVFHYSIPSIQETGDGAVESVDSLGSAKLQINGRRLLVSRLNPRKGVVLIARVRAPTTVCSTEFVPLELQSSSVALNWAYYVLVSEWTRQRLSARVNSATRSHQRADVADVLKMWHVVPPLAEQHDIANFLHHETTKIDALIAKVNKAINHLNEYRTALISAAVTGEIDVRHHGERSASDNTSTTQAGP